jgi:hypothetical protein
VNGISYIWSPATGLSSLTVSNPTASPSVTTNYILTATKNGSTISGKDTVIVQINQVPLSNIITDVSCYGGNNGTINLSATGGILPYTYLWNDNSVTEDRTGLQSGSYSVIVTDGMSCTKSYSYTVAQPQVALSVVASGGASPCQTNGTLTAVASGGTGPYSYNWSNGGTTDVISNLSPGNYDVTVTDSKGCTASVTAIITSACDVTINLKVFIQGYYIAPNTMRAVVDAIGHPSLCDTITVELRENNSPYALAFSKKETIDIHGHGTFVFSDAILNHSYFLVVKHKNSMEIWSKQPVNFNSSQMNIDFTSE